MDDHNKEVTSESSNSSHKGKTGLRRLLNAAGYSLSGLRAALQYESAFRQETILAAILIPTTFLLELGSAERALLIGAVFLVLIIELLNTAVEATVDRISLESHDLAKRAKDIGSAAVMLSLACMVCVWCIVLAGQ